MQIIHCDDINKYSEVHGEGEPLLMRQGPCFGISDWER